MTTPEPSWQVFERCSTCGSETGEPCYAMRRDSITRKCRPLRNPHRGRRQLGPSAGRRL